MAHFGHHLMTALPRIILPFVRDDLTLSANGLSNSQVAWVASAFSIAYGLGQLPGGWLADRIGRRAMIAIGVFGVAIVGILIGFSSTFTMFLILLVIMGIVGGGYHPAATPWISASAGEKNQGRAIGFHFVGGGAGFFVAPFVGAAIAEAWGWRNSFMILAIPCAIFGLIFFIILRRQKDVTHLKSVTGGHGAGAGIEKDRWRSLIALIAMSFVTGSLGSVMVFFSLYLIDDFNLAKDTATFVVAISSFAGIWAGPLGGWISDRIGRLPIIFLSSLATGAIVLAVRWVPYGPGLIALLLFSGINSYIGAPVSEAFIMGQTTPRHRSLIYGVYYMAGTGSTLFAPLMGLLIDKTSYQTAFMVSGIAMMVVVLIGGSILWSDRARPSPAPEPSH
jgi:MFS family permease